MRGSSGASFSILGDRVVKYADDILVGEKIMTQGMWLKSHQSPAVPKVFQVYARSYVMERLISPPLWALDHDVILRHLMQAAAKHIWSQPAQVQPDLESIEHKYESLCRAFGLEEIVTTLDKMMDLIDWDSLARCLTHGDPTFDNIMLRESSDNIGVVIGDPLPACPAVPDIRAVDLGKILQSLLGWEEVRYGRASTLRVSPADIHLCVTDKNEWRATIFWSIIHILRAMPYVNDGVRTRLKRCVNDALHLGF